MLKTRPSKSSLGRIVSPLILAAFVFGCLALCLLLASWGDWTPPLAVEDAPEKVIPAEPTNEEIAQSPEPVRTPEQSKKTPSGVVRLSGTPEEIGRRHGALLADKIKLMIKEYVTGDYQWEYEKKEMLAKVRTLKPSLPDWYRKELTACAKAAGVDEDVLLIAQCEGDIKSLPGCTVFVAFGEATHSGAMEIGRNFDYWGLESTEKCAIVLAVIPRPSDGYAFVSVGWSGILGGWTFINEKGLFVANNLGGFTEKNPKGLPTLILERMVAQKAATVAEAIEVIRKNPRMRGQAMIIGQVGDAKAGIKPDAVEIHYDAKTVRTDRQEGGFAFDSSVGTDPDRLKEMLLREDREPMEVIRSAGNSITLHSVAIRPQEHKLWVAHGRPSSAHKGKYVEYDLQSLLRR
ncbi:MAG: C45 family autoproteolytic acyltransferase/hydrolase [Planctomycetota bacterium]|jgi:hypothetical protein|nr:C45 family autoproteolytic acyltransferase/hydrolase [Planctomycetota bacterium]